MQSSKIQLGPEFYWDHSAPTIPAERVTVKGEVKFRIQCPHCEHAHYHAARNGHRVAHCELPDSPYHQTGYNVLLGK